MMSRGCPGAYVVFRLDLPNRCWAMMTGLEDVLTSGPSGRV